MRVALCGRNLDELKRILADFPVRVDASAPDVVISYGGDGALLGAERAFPGLPKCPIRDRSTSPKCPEHGEEHVIAQLVAGELAETHLIKLEARTSTDTSVVGINDVVISKRNIASAVRCRLWLGDELYKNQIVGDGLVIATPFGSTGYYRSITHSLFRVGIGLAFNNSTEPLDHLVIADETGVTVEVIRGPAVLLADNDPARISLDEGDCIRVARMRTGTVVLGLDIFRCPVCCRLRQEDA